MISRLTKSGAIKISAPTQQSKMQHVHCTRYHSLNCKILPTLEPRGFLAHTGA